MKRDIGKQIHWRIRGINDLGAKDKENLVNM